MKLLFAISRLQNTLQHGQIKGKFMLCNDSVNACNNTTAPELALPRAGPCRAFVELFPLFPLFSHTNFSPPPHHCKALKLPIMCWCAVKKLLTHSLTLLLRFLLFISTSSLLIILSFFLPFPSHILIKSIIWHTGQSWLS